MNDKKENCPECGAKCNIVKKPQYPNCNFMDYYALPQPDLTELRETFKDLIAVCTDLPLNELKYVQIVDKLIRAVKGVLDE